MQALTDSAITAASQARDWQDAQAGDQAAFARVYAAQVGSVYALCLRMTGDRANAEDCTQATFVQAWVKRDSFRGDARLGTWLHRIAVNTVLGTKRKLAAQPEVQALVEQEPAIPAESYDRDLERSIARLPERSRQVFVLHAVHGYKHTEIAELLTIAEGTSKAHYHRARELLRQHLSARDSTAPSAADAGAPSPFRPDDTGQEQPQ
ncbi:MAG: RNA polymerase sigma factor [Pseudomonadota bacterium]